MKKRTIVASLTAFCIMAAVLSAVVYFENIKKPVGAAEFEKNISVDLVLDGGTLEDSVTGLEKTIKLNPEDGAYADLYVENMGNIAVVATINGGVKQTFQPGESGHIDVEVTRGAFGRERSYTFKVAPISGTAAFRYDILQRDNC